MLRLGDINKKVFGYGNHNEALHSNFIGNCNWPIPNCLLHSNSWTNLIKILNLQLWCDDPSNEI